MSDGPVRITTGPELKKLLNELKLLSDGKQIRKELVKAVKQAAKPLVKNVKAEARSSLPKRGGLNQYVAASRFRTVVKERSTTVSATITGTKAKASAGVEVDLRAIDRGRLRHPTFGHRPWVTQQVAPGFFRRPTDDAGDDLRTEINQVMDDIIKRIS